MTFLPFARPTIDEQTVQAVCEVLRSGWLTGGPCVREFEQALSDYFGDRAVRVFNSGTASLEAALMVCGIGAGDEVITTPLTWVATASVILRAGARPVFVDVDATTRNLDLERVDAAVSERTRALMPVDLGGHPVDRDRLYALAEKHGLRVIEDAAQSMGASWRGRRIGSFGDLASFSFHANKNMTTGEGGCLVLASPDEALRAERWRLQGVVRDGAGGMDVEEVGAKANLTDIAAAIGLGQLRQLETFNARRRALARHYFAVMGEEAQRRGIGLPPAEFEDANWHMFQIVIPFESLGMRRGDFIQRMARCGIGVGVHYPALHLFSAYRRLGFRPGNFPAAERVGRQIVTLPLHPQMEPADVERVVGALWECL